MDLLISKNNKFFAFFENFKSESLGFYFSFIFHFIILLFAIGIPNFFQPKPIYLPNVIPIEIINIADTTSVPQEIKSEKEKPINKSAPQTKKFNNFDNQEITKIEEIEKKIKPKVEIKKNENIKIPKKDIVIKEKIETPIKLEKEKKNIVVEKIESLPSKKIKPKLKPKSKNKTIIEESKSDVALQAQPKPKPEKQFSIASMLKDLRNDKTSQKNEINEEEKKKIENISDNKKKKVDEKNLTLSITEIDLLRQQLSSCWIAPAGAVIKKGMTVKISAKLKQNRRIYENSVRIIDTNILKSNPFYGPITESAMRTLLHPDCIPLQLPENKYDLWKKLTIIFDYSIMKGYE